MPAILLYAAASLFYAILAFHFWRTRWRGASAPRLARLERAAILAPFALHTWLVYDMLWAQSELHFGFGQALSVMLWLAVLIYWIESRFLELEGMQAPILALASVCAPLPALFPGFASPASTHSTEFRLHLVLAMVAYGMFTIAALHALLMTLMERRLHGGALAGPLAALPPLLTMEKLLFQIILAGFVFLTLTLATGIAFSETLFGRAMKFDHKTVFAVASWLIFAALLAGRYLYGWRGRIALRWTLVGFAALLAKTDKLLGVILLGNNLVNAAAASLVTVIGIELFGDDKYVMMAATLVITFLILVFSEVTPKVIGAAYAEHIAPLASYVLKPLLRILYPVVWFVNLFVAPLLYVFRVHSKSGAHSQRMTMEELRLLVLESGQFMPKKHQSILVNLFDLEAITVEDVMTPRAQIEAIDLEASTETILAQLTTAYHTRLPAYRGELGNLAGILHLRKVMQLMRSEEFDRKALAGLLAQPYFVPAGTPAFAQLQYFQENRQRIALVVDEYGELQGLVTLEDIIEEIIGEFTTTAPVKSETYFWDKDGSALVEGSSVLRDLNRKLGLALPLDGPKTLNGLILEHLQDIPAAGVALKIADVPMEIVQTQDRVIKTVRLFRPRLSDLAQAA